MVEIKPAPTQKSPLRRHKLNRNYAKFKIHIPNDICMRLEGIPGVWLSRNGPYQTSPRAGLSLSADLSAGSW